MVNCRKNSPSVATFTAPAVTASAITMAAAMAAPPQDPGHPLSVLHLLHFLKNLLFGLVGGTEMGKGLLVQSLVDHDSASCKISFSFPLARMSQVCTVDGLAPMAAAISCTEQSS